jgi:hypothetical protein
MMPSIKIEVSVNLARAYLKGELALPRFITGACGGNVGAFSTGVGGGSGKIFNVSGHGADAGGGAFSTGIGAGGGTLKILPLAPASTGISGAAASTAGTDSAEALAQDFAKALVQLADTCAVGLPCATHEGVRHGQEAEELRAGIEQILSNTTSVRGDEAAVVLKALRKSLIFLLDNVDARDSLAFRENQTQPGE